MSAGTGCARAELRELAEERLSDAMLLGAHERWSSGYYLAGYAVELAFKACIARSFAAGTIPDLALVRKVYVHDLTDLMRLAGLESALTAAIETDRQFKSNWRTVAGWNVAHRYEIIDPERGRGMIAAVGAGDGVFQWIRSCW